MPRVPRKLPKEEPYSLESVIKDIQERIAMMKGYTIDEYDEGRVAGLKEALTEILELRYTKI